MMRRKALLSRSCNLLLVVVLVGAAWAWKTRSGHSPGPAMDRLAQEAPALPAGASGRALPARKTRPAVRSLAHSPLYFEANRGQTDPRVQFTCRSRGGTLFLTDEEMVLSLRAGRARRPQALTDLISPQPTGPRARTGDALRVKLLGARSLAGLAGEEALPGKVSYFLGNDPGRWRTNLPTYARVRCPEVYPGIDLVYYGAGGEVEHDFVVAPHVDPGAIAFAVDGASGMEVDAAGDLVLRTEGGEARLRRPRLYQTVGGARREVQGSYALRGRNTVGFQVASYDRARPLVIDPVLTYSTYLGGALGDWASDVAVDAGGSIYLTGQTESTDFPTAGPVQPGQGGDYSRDAFVTKLSSAGSLIYSTYLGGDSFDCGAGIAVGTDGSAYVFGGTDSTDFPRAAALQPYRGGGNDCFVARLNPAGTSLLYSTYLGGSSSDGAVSSARGDIAVDSLGNAYVTAETGSTDFPRLNPWQASRNGFTDAFVAKLAPDGSALVYSSYLGGSGYETGYGIAVDAANSAYVTGETSSADFPTVNPVQGTLAGWNDVFVAKVNPAGSALVYATYLGGSGYDCGLGSAVGADGSAHVVGRSASSDFPVVNPVHPGGPGGEDGFAAKLTPAGSALVYSTRLGGSGTDAAHGAAVDAAGNLYVYGSGSSLDFPTRNPIQAALMGSRDAFITVLNPTGSAFLFSTYLGGSGAENWLATSGDGGIAIDSSRTIYVVGDTYSPNFPTVSPVQPARAGSADAFIARIADPLPVEAAGLRATRTGPREVTLRWSAPGGPDVAGYRILRAETPRGPFAPVSAGLVVPAEGACRFVDRTARPGRSHCYRLEVVHSGGGTTATGIVRERRAP